MNAQRIVQRKDVKEEKRQEWNRHLEQYFNSWPEWKKKSGFYTHSYSSNFRTASIPTMGDSDDVK